MKTCRSFRTPRPRETVQPLRGVRVGWKRIEGGAAATLFKRALAIHEEQGDGPAATLAAQNEGVAQWKTGRPKEGLATLTQTLERAEAAGDKRTQVVLLTDHARVLASLGRPEEAMGFDCRADAALDALCEEVVSGLHEDTVPFDLSYLNHLRYSGKATYFLDLFPRFYEHLVFLK